MDAEPSLGRVEATLSVCGIINNPWPRGWVWRPCGRRMVGVSCIFVVLGHRAACLIASHFVARFDNVDLLAVPDVASVTYRALHFKRRRVAHTTRQVSGRGDMEGLQCGCSSRQLSETFGKPSPASVSDGFPTAVTRVSFSLSLAGFLHTANCFMDFVCLEFYECRTLRAIIWKWVVALPSNHCSRLAVNHIAEQGKYTVSLRGAVVRELGVFHQGQLQARAVACNQ